MAVLRALPATLHPCRGSWAFGELDGAWTLSPEKSLNCCPLTGFLGPPHRELGAAITQGLGWPPWAGSLALLLTRKLLPKEMQQGEWSARTP